MITVLFPSDYFNKHKVDETFESQAQALASRGIEYICINLDELSKFKIHSKLSSSNVIYRGWMLSKEQYTSLYNTMNQSGLNMLICPDSYIQSHHLPSWYDNISHLSPKTVIFDYNDELESNIKQLGWDRYFIKDYVKSLSTAQSPIVKDIDELNSLLESMKKYRGFIEGGICVRKVEDLLPETEQRFFVINGVVFGDTKDDIELTETLNDCARRHNQLFYSIDVCRNTGGEYRVIEIGDGQVSDLKEWSPEAFCDVIRQARWNN